MTDIDIDKIEILEQFRESIYESGSSHSPEFWQVAKGLDKYIDMLKDGRGNEAVLTEAKEDLREMGDNTHCEHEAPETVVAVLTESITSPGCNGCGKQKSVAPNGYCWSCREIYDRGP